MMTAKDYLDAANAVVPTLNAAEANEKYNNGTGAFIDVRDSADIAKTGTIKGAHRIPRGMIEFRADPAMKDFHNPIFEQHAELYLICGAGGQAALSGKTLMDMGYTNEIGRAHV